MAAHSVELVLDDASVGAVRAEWAALLAADLPSRARNASPTNAPHLTLVAAAGIPADLDAELTAAVAGLPLRVRLGAFVLFGTHRPVLARLVVPTSELLALHERVHAVVRHLPGLVPHVAPGDWTPHVTLARGIPAARLGEALAAVGSGAEEPVGLTGARRWDPDEGATTDLA